MYTFFRKNLNAAKIGATLSGAGDAISYIAPNTIFHRKPADYNQSFFEGFSESFIQATPSSGLQWLYMSYAHLQGENLYHITPGIVVGLALQYTAFEIIATTQIPSIIAIGASTVLVAGSIQIFEKLMDRLEQQPWVAPAHGR